MPAVEGRRLAEAVARMRVAAGARIRITGSRYDIGSLLVQVNLRVDRTAAWIQTFGRGPSDALPVAGWLEQRIRRHLLAVLTAYRPKLWRVTQQGIRKHGRF